MHPAATRRSRFSFGIVRCTGLLLTRFNEENSSLVSGTSRVTDDNSRFNFAMRLDTVNCLSQSTFATRCRQTRSKLLRDHEPPRRSIGMEGHEAEVGYYKSRRRDHHKFAA